MKRKKTPTEKASPGTLLAARARAEGNKWTDAERDKLGDQFMKLYYGANLLRQVSAGQHSAAKSAAIVKQALRQERYAKRSY